MKYFFGVIGAICLGGFLLGFGLARYQNTIELTGAFPALPDLKPDHVEQLEAFYAPQLPSPSISVLEEAVDQTTAAAWLLCLDAQVDTMLAMWHRESAFSLDARGAPYEDSKGITQTRMKDTPKWRAFWKSKGVTLGPFKEVRTQVFFGVAEFQEKLKQAKGDVKEAVRRYNGSGKKAKKYADRVMVSRAIIFGRPYTAGEKQALTCTGDE